jgi:hypothetical protein
MSTDHIAHGSPEAYREFIAEAAGMARIQAQLIETYASIGDDAGAAYALRKLMLYAKTLLTTVCDLQEENLRREFE